MRALGGPAGIDGIVEGMLQRALSDPRLLPFFGDADLPNLRTQLKAQFCRLSGGPCVYEGANMRKAHAGLDLRAADFNALVEVLQDTMAARGIPFAVQNRFLAQLAPFHRDVVNTR
ncbi:group 1 truncated hemoglobin [Piscinibacter sakaiensis]|uniref:group I truncated hemoglobin n=1 Tax=Piscinibacter sakaiensis TaxID=1547922 RepID=UPI00372C33D0